MSRNAWVRRLAGVVVAGVLCSALVLLLAVTALPRLTGIELRTVVSGSMAPALRQGALVLAVPMRGGAPRPGQVIMFREPDRPSRVITHRVVAVQPDGTLQTKGDVNAAPDPWFVRPSDVMGRVVFDLRGGGRVLDALRSRAGFVLLLLIPGLLVLGGEAMSWQRFLRRDRLPEARALAQDDRTRERLGLARAARPPYPLVPRPSFIVATVALVAVAASAVAAVAYLAAPRPGDAAAQLRLAGESGSLAQDAAARAIAGGYAGDLRVLRDAADPALAGTPAAAGDALARLLAADGTPFTSLSLIDRAGRVAATTDPGVRDVHDSAAFLLAVAHGGVATSLPPALPGVVEFAAPVRGPGGAPAGVLFARTTAVRLWAAALTSSIDGSRTLIVDRQGRVVAGGGTAGGAGALGAPYAGTARRLTVAGMALACGVAPIGAGTHLDMGWQVAACLPESLAAADGGASLWRLGLSTSAAAALAVMIAAAALYLLARNEHARSVRRQRPVGFEAIEAHMRGERGRA